MSQSLYSAATGMRAQQQNIDTIANNIANVNTNGYKKSRVDFEDAVYSEMNDPSGDTKDKNLQLGHGMIAAGQTKSFSQGIMQDTGVNTDTAIQGEGFYAVEDIKSGSTFFTRVGSFNFRDVEGTNYLATVNGDFVLDQSGNRIKCNFPIENVTVDGNGVVSDGTTPTATLGVFTFDNPQGLEEKGNLLYGETVNSGKARLSDAGSYQIHQGKLEGSNVDMAEEMTQLLKAQRAYTFLSRAISTADEMKQTANDIRR